mgnify:CR=1 FL=1
MADTSNHVYELTSTTAIPTNAASCISSDAQWGIDGQITAPSGVNVIIQSEDWVDEPLVDRT